GGKVLDKAIEFDPKTKLRKALIKAVRWYNIGVSKTPVNQHVSTCATVPVGAFAKCWTAEGLDLAKALEAGYGTDSAALTGGAALRKKSLEGAMRSYFDFRNKVSAALRRGPIGENPGVQERVEYAAKTFRLSRDQAAEWVERL